MGPTGDPFIRTGSATPAAEEYSIDGCQRTTSRSWLRTVKLGHFSRVRDLVRDRSRGTNPNLDRDVAFSNALAILTRDQESTIIGANLLQFPSRKNIGTAR